MKLLKQLYHYGRQANTHDVLKALAMLVVFVDHLGFYLLDNNIYLRVIGRAAAPLFFFVVGTPKNFRFKLDILIYGLILTFSNYFFLKMVYINILINFVIIKAVLDHYNPAKKSGWELSGLFILLCVLTIYLNPLLEYGSFGLLFAIGGRLISQKDTRGYYWIIATLVVYYLLQSMLFHFIRNMVCVYVFVGICIALGWIMCSFRLREFSLPTFIRTPTLFISRYSLQLYFIQVLIFQMY